MDVKELNHTDDFKVKPGKKISLMDFSTSARKKDLNKETNEELVAKSIQELSLMQDKLYAENNHSILIVLQAMDAAGKDGIVKHLMSGLNPTGVKVYSFKTPSSIELDHDYFWRHYNALPARGEIAIFNRSHYENVLITKVHPEYILNEDLPNIKTVKDIDKDFWESRYHQICRFEKNISENGTIILKFFLHISKEEQKKRFLERIDNPKKNWKFSVADLKERDYWDQYQKAYEMAISNTSTQEAPWFVIPADDKWYSRLMISTIIKNQFEKLNLSYPKVSKSEEEALQKAKAILLKEE